MSGPVFAEANAFADQFPLDVVMAVETVGDRKRQEGTDTHGMGPELHPGYRNNSAF